MCLIINKKQCPKGYKIAKKNIPCYKVLLKTYSGRFETPNIRQTVNIKTGIEANSFQTDPINKLRIDKGIHSYTNLKSAQGAQNSWYRILNAYVYTDAIVLKGYIPRGTKYWVGMWHEFCSERIVFAEK